MRSKSKIENRKFQIDFVGIGASKCGTTWLGHVLEEHPQICLSEPKEVHFFNDRLSFNSFLKPHFGRGIQWYKKFFNHCSPGKIKGEITNRYCVDPLAAQRIKEHNPHIRILFCLRHPVDRIWSHYQFAKYFERKEKRPIEQAIREEEEYIRMSKYHRTLSLYLQHFSQEQIFLIWFEDIQRKPAELMKDVFSFLGVDPSFQPKTMFKKSNSARISRFPFLQTAIRRMNNVLIGFGLSGLIKRLKMAGLGNFVMKANSRPLAKTKMPETVKQYIINELTDDVHQLEKLTGKDLSHWLV
ncbi:MAG: sulfotransferase domain-containing protein [Saprospiraceae bacterium]|uniref:Sulfotransferase domain-containing protein n=1 Tax=Candidatus Opimibacter skivensis TaxID=2982028 RepID=A0A9D7SWE3_9BACT|nr:sulfotransferase domain-containing protein [Candidatus Opimibacter skivensis]